MTVVLQADVARRAIQTRYLLGLFAEVVKVRINDFLPIQGHLHPAPGAVNEHCLPLPGFFRHSLRRCNYRINGPSELRRFKVVPLVAEIVENLNLQALHPWRAFFGRTDEDAAVSVRRDFELECQLEVSVLSVGGKPLSASRTAAREHAVLGGPVLRRRADTMPACKIFAVEQVLPVIGDGNRRDRKQNEKRNTNDCDMSLHVIPPVLLL